MRRTAAEIYDEWLVLRAQGGGGIAGDEAALAEIIKRWHGRLYRHARRLVDHGHAADDVVQEAWLAITRGLPRLSDPARFPPWAYRIVTNKCRDWTRRQSRDRARHVSDDGAVNAVASEACSGSDGVLDENEARLGALRRAMRELSSDHRAALALHYLDGMSTAEIAIAMNVSPGTIKSRLHYAREHLRAILERHERIET